MPTHYEIAASKRTVNKLEKSYIEGRKQFEGLKRTDRKRMATGKVYYALDDIDSYGVFLEWYEEDIEKLDELFHKGLTIDRLAAHFNRTEDEIGILIMDRAIKGHLSVVQRQKKGNMVYN
ncbi:hypothetical protein [Priestia megaterium]|uniref:hypothetical protein n=1 Tax=Priestia megaterium TaxID=1404 RepID=UPI000BF62F70|nr:hypothetical protein [Priestia megaterium]PFI93391.1 hypothetical protein COI84_19690 [Priestia megaterium]PGR11792.1 hypothetical protein COC62_14310 [Priestia megaterium]